MGRLVRFKRLLSTPVVIAALVAGCTPSPTPPLVSPTNAAGAPNASGPTAATAANAPAGGASALTEVGTPRNETLIVQTFDGKTDNPSNMNPLSGSYSIWRGFRELGWGYLWEMDTATGKSYPELAADMPKVLDDKHTQFQVSLKPGIYWSDGVEFTADDVTACRASFSLSTSAS
jgi:ABC-type transport system substrate-binding protein